MDSPKVITKKAPIHIKKIILEIKKVHPQKAQKTKSTKTYKPAAAAQLFNKRQNTSRVKPRSFPQHPETINKIVPMNLVPEKSNRFEKPNIKPMTPVSLISHMAKPVLFEPGQIAFNRKPTPTQFRRIEKAQPKDYSDLFSVSIKKPMVLVDSTVSFTPKPFTKPIQVASIPEDFVTVLSDENTLGDLVLSGKNRIPSYTRDDLKALKKDYSSQVWRRIADAKFYPRIARKQEMEGKPIVEFELRDDGQLISCLIIQISSKRNFG
jgi:outer membrane biosynthesis protein TonB